jgi:hypothetical protein
MGANTAVSHYHHDREAYTVSSPEISILTPTSSNDSVSPEQVETCQEPNEARLHLHAQAQQYATTAGTSKTSRNMRNMTAAITPRISGPPRCAEKRNGAHENAVHPIKEVEEHMPEKRKGKQPMQPGESTTGEEIPDLPARTSKQCDQHAGTKRMGKQPMEDSASTRMRKLPGRSVESSRQGGKHGSTKWKAQWRLEDSASTGREKQPYAPAAWTRRDEHREPRNTQAHSKPPEQPRSGIAALPQEPIMPGPSQRPWRNTAAQTPPPDTKRLGVDGQEVASTSKPSAQAPSDTKLRAADHCAGRNNDHDNLREHSEGRHSWRRSSEESIPPGQDFKWKRWHRARKNGWSRR